MLKPIIGGQADVVYGSRFSGGDSHRVLYFWHSIGNRFLTLLSNMMTDLNLTDMETCYKVFRRDILDRITLVEDRFGFDPEITAKVSHLKPLPRIYEVGIDNGGVVYVSADGRYLFSGVLIDMVTQENLTDRVLAVQRVEALNSVSESFAGSRRIP